MARREGGAQRAGPHSTHARARNPPAHTHAHDPRDGLADPHTPPSRAPRARRRTARSVPGSREEVGDHTRARAGGQRGGGTALPHPAGRPRRSGSEREADRGAQPEGQSRPCGRSARARLRSRPGARPRPGSEPRRRARAQGWHTPLDGQSEGDQSRPARPPRPRRGTGTGAEGPGPGPTPDPGGKGEQPAGLRSTFTHTSHGHLPGRDHRAALGRTHAPNGATPRGERTGLPRDADNARDTRLGGGPRQARGARRTGGGGARRPDAEEPAGRRRDAGRGRRPSGVGGAEGHLWRSRPPPGRTRGSHRQQPPSTKTAPRGTWSGRPGLRRSPRIPHRHTRSHAASAPPEPALPRNTPQRPTQTLRAPTGPHAGRRRPGPEGARHGDADTGPTSVAGGDAPRRRSRVRAQTGRPTA